MTVSIEVVRSGLTESVHEASLVILDSANGPAHHWGETGAVAYARSALKPLQATAMVRAGLRLRTDQLAIGCSSHDATPAHTAVVSGILADAGLDPSCLRCPPALPGSDAARDAYVSGGGVADSLHHECSGKHAAMLATCALNRWPLETYLVPDHPLQRAIRDVVEELTGDTIAATGVDGCGAPTHSVSLSGLARAFSRLAGADDHSPDGAAAAAMRAFPELIGGEGRDITDAMRAAPGLIVKDGAEGIYGLALPDGRAAAFKIHDGGLRAAPPLVFGILHYWGVPVEPSAWGVPPVLGHGAPVGTIRLRDGQLPPEDA
jgi:L-asparaginase II